MTLKAKRFVEANAESPVVYGSIIFSKGGNVQGVVYRLEDGRSFTLTVADTRSLPGVPRWAV